MTATRLVRRLSAIALSVGAVVGVAAVPASAHGDDFRDRGPHFHFRPVVTLGEIQYNSPGPDDGSNRSLNREWVEVTNTGRRAVDLDGWTLSDRDGNVYRFDGFRLESRSSVRVHTGFGRDTDTDVYQDLRYYVWGNRSDTATLRNDRGRVIDVQSWGRRGDRDRDEDRFHVTAP